MTNAILVLSFATICSAILAIFGRNKNENNMLLYVFKPLTTILIIIIAIIASSASYDIYQQLIIVGLVFALFGDVFLMLPNRFIAGVISFFISHVLFSAAFICLNTSFHWWIMAIVLLPSAAVYAYLHPNLGQLKIAVLLYVLIIAFMSSRALENLFVLNNFQSILIAIGTIFFMASDSLLSINLFRKPIKAAGILILSTYYFAIYLIAIALLYS